MLPYISIIVPCYNEKNTIVELINKINLVPGIKKQIILVDDCSTDGSSDLIINKLNNRVSKIIHHKKNLGKGACIKSAQKYIEGDIVIIQDSDLEYDPNDYHVLIKPILNNNSKVVYGSRLLKKNARENLENFSHWIRVVGNYFLTKFSNFVNRQNLTDAHTCYKVFEGKLFKKILLKENNFNFCPEITTKIGNLNYQIIEVPISYYGRNYTQGKKISAIDGVKALQTILKYKFFDKKNLNDE